MELIISNLNLLYPGYHTTYNNGHIEIFVINKAKRTSKALTDAYWISTTESVKFVLKGIKKRITDHIAWCEFATKNNLS